MKPFTFKKILVGTSLIIIVFAIISWQIKQQKMASLKDAYKKDFLIGAALNVAQIEERDSATNQLIKQQFSTVTPENIMKAEVIHPKWNEYNFTLADKLVDYGTKNNIKINAHTLIWHSQLPSFIRSMKNADSVKQYFINHITTLATRYDGKVLSWDVVNEALEEDGSMRKSIFLEKLGADYVIEAFRLAQKSAPHTELYYNDYNIEEPKKRAGAITLIKKIQEAGVRIDGVGIQGHWRYNNVPFKNIEESIEAFSKLGIKVMFTELDLGVLPNPWDGNIADVNKRGENNAAMNAYANNLPDSVQSKQAKAYEDLFKLFLKHKDVVSRVTFWGVHDGQSWLNDWPIKGRTNYPLLFDRQLQPKQSFFNIISLKK